MSLIYLMNFFKLKRTVLKVYQHYFRLSQDIFWNRIQLFSSGPGESRMYYNNKSGPLIEMEVVFAPYSELTTMIIHEFRFLSGHHCFRILL